MNTAFGVVSVSERPVYRLRRNWFLLNVPVFCCTCTHTTHNPAVGCTAYEGRIFDYMI